MKDIELSNLVTILKQEIKELKQELNKYKHDNLTGLLTRHDCGDYLDKLWYDVINNNCTITYTYLDLNGLHYINNTYGHDIGDKYITTLTSILKSKFKESNIYRIGGDEFCIINKNDTKSDTDSKLDMIDSVDFEYGTVVVTNNNMYNNIEEIVKSADNIVINKKMKQDRRRN